MTALSRLLLGEVADTPRTRDYQARTDASIAAMLPRLDAATGLLRPPGEAPTWDTSAGRWGAADGVGLASRGEWLWYYELERGSAALLGRLAWCWRQPLSRYHRAPEVLDAVRRGLQTFAAHQEPDGSFRFCPVKYATCWGTHEMAWRLEPLLYAWAWAGEALPAAERAAATAMLERAAAFLAAHPCRDRNNRGAVWSAIMALASHAFGQPAYLAAAQANWAPVRERLFQGGQVMEDTGPDSNYSYTAVAYVYLYRRFAEDDSLDAPLRQAQEWFARMRTLGGVPFEGMSSRVRGGLKSKLDDLLPMLERYTADEPFFATLVERYLGFMDASGMGSHVNHGCDMRIWAMLEHRPGGPPPPATEPDWFHEFGGEYKTDATLYAVIKRGYQGCLTLRGALPLKGWQTWAWGSEPPVIHPGPRHGSGTVAWGFDSATVPVSKAAASGVWADRQWRAGEPASYSFRQEGLWTHCVFTPCATLVLLAGDLGRRRTTWCVNLATSPAPRIEEDAVRLGELRGRLHFEGAPPQLEQPPAGGVALLHLVRDEVVSAFAFSEGSWQWLPPGAATRRWRDASGTYAVTITVGERPGFTVTREETP